MFNVDSINRLAKRIRRIKECPIGVFVTVRSEHGHYYDIDINDNSFNFTMRYGRKEGYVKGSYRTDSGGFVQLTGWECTLGDKDIGDLFHTVDRTIALHRECVTILNTYKHLLFEPQQIGQEYFHD